MNKAMQTIKEQILATLKHPEASDGLYFRNFQNLHEEDERDPVVGEEVEVLDALRELIEEGSVRVQEGGEELVFLLG